MKIKKLFKFLDKETIFTVFDPKGEKIAVGTVEDFLNDPDIKFVERKVKSIKLLIEKIKAFEDSDYPYLEVQVE